MIDSTPQASRTGTDTNQVFAALSNRRRRVILRILERESSMELTALAARVASRERAESDAPAADVDEVRMDLYRCHLPKLADAGFVEYSATADSVTLFVDPSDELPARLTALE